MEIEDDLPPGGRVGDYVALWVVLLLLVAATVFFVRRSRRAPTRARLVLGNSLVLLSLLGLLALGAETYLRWFCDATDSFGLTLTNRAWMWRHLLPSMQKNGFRDLQFTWEVPDGRRRVAFFGDSFTMGWGVDRAEDCYPQIVRAALEARFPGRYDVVNLAMIGLSTKDEIRDLGQILPKTRVDTVVLGYCLNDVEDLLPEERRFRREDMLPPAWLDNSSFLADFLWFRLSSLRDPRIRDYFAWVKDAYDDPALWGREERQIAELTATCRASGAALEVAIFPFFHAWGPDYPYDRCHERVANAFRTQGVAVLDLRDAYRGIPGADLVCNRFDAHPNERAHRIAAGAVLDRFFGAR